MVKMLFLFKNFNFFASLVKTLIICFALVYTTEAGSLAPPPIFTVQQAQDKHQAAEEIAALSIALYLSSCNIRDPEQITKTSKELADLSARFREKNIRVRVFRVEYICSQPEVYYVTMKINKEKTIARSFDTCFKGRVYPAKVLREATFIESGKTIQIITETSYKIIFNNEETVSQNLPKPEHKFKAKAKKITGWLFNVIPNIHFIGSILRGLIQSQAMAGILGVWGVAAITIILGAAILLVYFWSHNWFASETNARSLDAQAKEVLVFEKSVIIGIETSWIPQGRCKKQIKKLLEMLTKKYGEKIKIINDKAGNLFTDIIKNANEQDVPAHNILLIAGEDMVDDRRFEWLMKNGIKFLAINEEDIEKATNALSYDRGKGIYIDFPEILEIGLKIILNKTGLAGQNPDLIYDPEINSYFAVFKVRPIVINAEEMERIYRGEIRILRAA